MLTQIVISDDVWTPITTAGQSGACWLDDDCDGAKGQADIRITHSTTGTPTSEASVGKRVWRVCGNGDVLPFTADSGSDIFYARPRNVGDAATLSVDVV